MLGCTIDYFWELCGFKAISPILQIFHLNKWSMGSYKIFYILEKFLLEG
jgi:hypothetical protein